MDNCFALIGAHYHAITVRSTNGKTRISKTLYCRGDSFKRQLHTTHVGAVAWELHVNSPNNVHGEGGILNVQIYIWSLFKAKERFVVRQWSLQIILLQRHNKFYPVVFSLQKAIKNSRVQIRQLSPLMQMNIHPMTGWRRDEHGTHKHTHTQLMDSVSHIRSKTTHSLFWITS